MSTAKFGSGSWRKSSFSGENGTCVEVAHIDPEVGIRDSKNTAAGYLTVARAAWTSFVHVVSADD